MSTDFKMWVCQEDKHNKWWTFEVSGNTVTTKFGRIGQKGQSSSKTFRDTWSRDAYANKKMSEKTGKGYNPISKEDFDLLRLQAEIMGTGSKIEGIAVILQDKKFFHEVPNQVAYDPSLELSLMISFRLRDRHGATDVYTFLFKGDDVFDLNIQPVYSATHSKDLGFRPVRSWQGNASKVNTSHPLWKMIEKLQEVLGTTL